MTELYAELVAQLNSDEGSDNKRHCIETFTALLSHWTDRGWVGLRLAPDPDESSDALRSLLFEWSSPHEDDSLIGLAGRVLGHDDRLVTELHHLEEILRSQARHELELRVVASH
ncbi:hypothetical protein ABZX90_11140 [Streptomyces sp. NPDC002935]|uniref:hypothetical protein n=1 Tax=Streptomyces sp. NPDC002935 TaxID=3154545 RepID=UPI0033BA8AF3